MRGEHAAGKGDKNRLQDKKSIKAYRESKLWDNIEKNKKQVKDA